MEGKNTYLWLMGWIGGSMQAGIHAGGGSILLIFLFIILYTFGALFVGDIIFKDK